MIHYYYRMISKIRTKWIVNFSKVKTKIHFLFLSYRKRNSKSYKNLISKLIQTNWVKMRNTKGLAWWSWHWSKRMTSFHFGSEIRSWTIWCVYHRLCWPASWYLKISRIWMANCPNWWICKAEVSRRLIMWAFSKTKIGGNWTRKEN